MYSVDLLTENFPVFLVLVGEEHLTAHEAVFQGVHGETGFPLSCTGASGFLSVPAACFDLFRAGHGLPPFVTAMITVEKKAVTIPSPDNVLFL